MADASKRALPDDDGPSTSGALVETKRQRTDDGSLVPAGPPSTHVKPAKVRSRRGRAQEVGWEVCLAEAHGWPCAVP